MGSSSIVNCVQARTVLLFAASPVTGNEPVLVLARRAAASGTRRYLGVFAVEAEQPEKTKSRARSSSWAALGCEIHNLDLGSLTWAEVLVGNADWSSKVYFADLGILGSLAMLVFCWEFKDGGEWMPEAANGADEDEEIPEEGNTFKMECSCKGALRLVREKCLVREIAELKSYVHSSLFPALFAITCPASLPSICSIVVEASI
ncbi:hypothetical protein Droror1_Dr00015004 [Drosera rotundifolia]